MKTELIGLALCLSFGFVFGIIYSSVDNWDDAFWLKDEMVARYLFVLLVNHVVIFVFIRCACAIDRGQLRSLWVGVLIALPSGAGVALSVLGM